MGHQTVLVVGDNFRDQLDKFQRSEYAERTNRHFVEVDISVEAKRNYETSSRPGKDDVLAWMKIMYGISLLSEGQMPNVLEGHRNGWLRLDSAGQVCQVIQREIPDGFIDWFEKTESSWKLKPGADGLDIEYATETLAINGFAGSARKSAIDFEGMRNIVSQCVLEKWDHAKAICGSQTWEPFKSIWLKYGNSDDGFYVALEEWKKQPTVEAIREAPRCDEKRFDDMSQHEKLVYGLRFRDSYSDIDPLRLSRNDCAKQYTLRQFLRYSDVIWDGVKLKDFQLRKLHENPAERQFFDSLPEETVLTLANIHC